MRLHMALQVMIMSKRTLTKLTHKRFSTQMDENMVLDVAHLVRGVRTRVTYELVLVNIRPKHGRTSSAMFDQVRDPRVRHDNTAVLTKVRIQFQRRRIGEKCFNVER